MSGHRQRSIVSGEKGTTAVGIPHSADSLFAQTRVVPSTRRSFRARAWLPSSGNRCDKRKRRNTKRERYFPSSAIAYQPPRYELSDNCCHRSRRIEQDSTHKKYAQRPLTNRMGSNRRSALPHPPAGLTPDE